MDYLDYKKFANLYSCFYEDTLKEHSTVLCTMLSLLLMLIGYYSVCMETEVFRNYHK